MIKRLTFLVALLAAITIAGAAVAEPDQGLHVGAYVGYLNVNEDELPNLGEIDLEDVSYGARIGWIENRLGFEATVTRFLESNDVGEVETWFVDASVLWNFIRGDAVTVSAYGGVGWAFIDQEWTVEDVKVDLSDDSLTLNAGVALWFQPGDGFYVRPDAKLRWIEQGGGLDYEVGVGLGWIF